MEVWEVGRITELDGEIYRIIVLYVWAWVECNLVVREEIGLLVIIILVLSVLNVK